MALLELSEVHATYGPIKALHGISIEVEEGKVATLLGANGAGKTTTLRSISGMVHGAGSIRFAGVEILGRTPEQVAKLGIAHVPSGRGTLGQLTVWENLQMGAYLRRDRSGVRQDQERAIAYFPWIGQRRAQLAGTLSGGEQQMLAMARALMLRPRLLLLDEPSLGLAPLVVRDIFGIIRTINREEGTTILIVEQNANVALRAADAAYVLEVGRVVLSGPAGELATHESVRKSYLGN